MRESSLTLSNLPACLKPLKPGRLFSPGGGRETQLSIIYPISLNVYDVYTIPYASRGYV
jgi:hypothetical protein